MGSDKAMADLGGSPMITHVIDALVSAGAEPVIAGAPRPGVPYTAVADAPGIHGPVAGLLAAMRAMPAITIVLVGCDQPFLRPDTVERVATTPGDVVVPVDVVPQALCAVYRPGIQDAIETIVTRDPSPSLRRVLDATTVTEVPAATWRSWGEDGRSWLSVDTPGALAAARSSWPDPPTATIRP